MFNKTETKVIEIIKRIVDHTNNLMVDEEIDKLGINSFVFVKLIVELEKEFGIEINIEDILVGKFNVISDIAQYLDEKLAK